MILDQNTCHKTLIRDDVPGCKCAIKLWDNGLGNVQLSCLAKRKPNPFIPSSAKAPKALYGKIPVYIHPPRPIACNINTMFWQISASSIATVEYATCSMCERAKRICGVSLMMPERINGSRLPIVLSL